MLIVFGPEEQQQWWISSLCCAESEESWQKTKKKPTLSQTNTASLGAFGFPFIPLAGQHCVVVVVVVVCCVTWGQGQRENVNDWLVGLTLAAHILFNRLKNVGIFQRMVYQTFQEHSFRDATDALEHRKETEFCFIGQTHPEIPIMFVAPAVMDALFH